MERNIKYQYFLRAQEKLTINTSENYVCLFLFTIAKTLLNHEMVFNY